MTSGTSYGILSLVPVVLTLALCFWTKDAIFALFVGCAVGTVIAGSNPAWGLSKLFQDALGNADFIWVMMIEVFVGIMIAFFMRAGVTQSFATAASRRIKSRRGAAGFAWLLGVFVFWSDYFSPLFSGPIARPITDEKRVSREMLSYLLDSTSAPVCTIIPLSGWAVYIAGLLKGNGPIASAQEGMNVFIRSIPFNFYGWFAVVLAGLIAFGIVPNFGPMRKAELRAMKEGKTLRDGAIPLAGGELEQVAPLPGKEANLVVYLFIPVLIVVAIAIGTFAVLRSTKILEAFIAAVLYLAVALAAGRYFKDVKDLMSVVLAGIKGVLPAIMILALAYCINSITKSLGAAQYVISVSKGWMTSSLLPLITFLTGAFISFFTGTSWGTYAILTPIVLPIALGLSGGAISPVVLASVAAIVGGGAFGDHCSPVSDTTALSSFAAACDHMDHVATQLPYACTAAAAAAVLFLVMGLTV